MTYPRTIFAFRDFIYQCEDIPMKEKERVNKKLIQLAACFEYITMGHFLHNQIAGTQDAKTSNL